MVSRQIEGGLVLPSIEYSGDPFASVWQGQPSEALGGSDRLRYAGGETVLDGSRACLRECD